jgi:hypothetical protein
LEPRDEVTAAVGAEEPAPAPIAASEGGLEDGQSVEDGQPKKKRTRRGSRGGRRRKKAPAANGGETAGADSTPDAEAPGAEELDGQGEVPEYVPMSEWIEDFDARAERAR